LRIAIDGPAAVGKTSVGRALAEEFGCRFVETGKMYRAVALALDRGVPLDAIRIEVTDSERLLLDGEDVTDLLHTPEYDQKSSQVATRPEVRARLVELQRDIAEQSDVVMEGRDIGTVVLPDADVKLFLRAAPQIRAKRRMKQRRVDDYLETLRQLNRRDDRDESRSIAPLKPARDATIIDTDRKTLIEVISAASNLVRERLGKRCHDG
jgi:cytidylate kinase